MSTCSSTSNTGHGALRDQLSALSKLVQLVLDKHPPNSIFDDAHTRRRRYFTVLETGKSLCDQEYI